MNKLVFASVISEIQQSDIFMTVKARICEAPAANLNGARVTEAFIDEIVSNTDRYVSLPLYADVRALTKGDYRRLGHLYDSKTGEFHSTQIGSFYQFEKETFETEGPEGKKKGCYLVGYARIPKRNKKLSKAISELFADGALKFSFEVAVGEYEELDDDTILIDASDSNYLEGTAIVTFPACEEAVALELVAQRKADDIEGGEKEMTGEKIAEATVEKTEAAPEVAEVTQDNEPEKRTETAAETAAEATAEKAEETPAENETAEQENAAVVIRESNYNTQSVSAYDTETGTEVYQSVSVDTTVTKVEQDSHIVEADDGVHIAEDEGDSDGETDGSGGSGDTSGVTPVETPVETPGDTSGETPGVTPGVTDESGDTPGKTPEETDPEPAAEDPVLPGETEKKTAEQLIAELAETIASLKAEVEELKAQKTVVAETKTVTAEVNPLIDPIQNTGKYTLLEKENKQFTSYSLLS